jgi:hypothetical protein
MFSLMARYSSGGVACSKIFSAWRWHACVKRKGMRRGAIEESSSTPTRIPCPHSSAASAHTTHLIRLTLVQGQLGVAHGGHWDVLDVHNVVQLVNLRERGGCRGRRAKAMGEENKRASPNPTGSPELRNSPSSRPQTPSPPCPSGSRGGPCTPACPTLQADSRSGTAAPPPPTETPTRSRRSWARRW